MDSPEFLQPSAKSLRASFQEFTQHHGERPHRLVANMAIQLKLRRNPNQPLTAEQKSLLTTILHIIFSSTSAIPEDNDLHAEDILKIVIGDHDQCLKIESAWVFPEPYPDLARASYERFTINTHRRSESHDAYHKSMSGTKVADIARPSGMSSS